MKFKFRANAIGFCSLAACLIFASAALADEPEGQEIAVYIADNLPDTLEIAGIKFKVFPVDEYSGRVSIEGSLSTSQALYYEDCNCPYPAQDLVNRNYQPLIQAAAARGVPPAMVMQIVKERKLVPMGLSNVQPLYKLKHPVGSEIPFRAELGYRETVSGFDFTGRPQYELGKLQTEAQIGQYGLIMGGPQYLQALETTVAFYDGIRKKQAIHRGEIERFLTGGHLVGRYPLMRGEPVQDVFYLDFGNTQIGWTPERQVGGEVVRWRFSWSGFLVWLTEVEWNGVAYSAGSSVRIQLGGKYFTNAEPMKNAEMRIDIPPQAGRRQEAMTGRMVWAGSKFVSQPGAPEDGWQITMSATKPQVGAAAVATSAGELKDPLPLVMGTWTSASLPGLSIRIESEVGRVDGPASARPEGWCGELVIRPTSRERTFLGTLRCAVGGNSAVLGRIEEDRMLFRKGETEWVFERQFAGDSETSSRRKGRGRSGEAQAQETEISVPETVDTLTGLQGDWQTVGGEMTIRVDGKIGRIVSGGSGPRPDGIDMLLVDEIAPDGSIRGRTRFSGGQLVGVAVRIDGDKLRFEGRGYQWHWERAQDG